jgi:hypothetical protein
VFSGRFGWVPSIFADIWVCMVVYGLERTSHVSIESLGSESCSIEQYMLNSILIINS